MLSTAEVEAIARERMMREHKRPLPVDADFRDTRLVGGIRVPMGVQAQGAFGVLDVPWRDDVDLVSYRRAPWAVLRAKVREMGQTCLLARLTAGGTDSVGVNDVGNAARTLGMWSSASAASIMFNNAANAAGLSIVCRWGSSSTAATSADFALTAQVDSFTAGSFSRDTGLFTDTFSGSKVYAGANTTGREIGFSQQYNDTGGTVRDILFDHTVIGDTTVNTGQTPAVAYVVQF